MANGYGCSLSSYRHVVKFAEMLPDLGDWIFETVSQISRPGGGRQRRSDRALGRHSQAAVMSIVEVAVPMLRGKRRFYVEKGRRWDSVIEHLMLEAVSRAPSTTADLSLKSKLHRRIVVEAFIRLMRVGWVEIIGARVRLSLAQHGRVKRRLKEASSNP